MNAALKEFFDVPRPENPDADYYLEVVDKWKDPNPALVVEKHGGIHVVRDDLLVGGTKERFYDYMVAKEDNVREWVYGCGSRGGYGQIGMAAVCKKHGKKCTIFIAKGKVLHPNTVIAQNLGATIHEVNMGMLTVTESRAKKYTAEDPFRRHVSFSGDDTMMGSIIKFARTLPFTPDEIWSAAGSGLLNRGLQMAFPDAPAFMVSVGHVLAPWEIGRATMIRHPLAFAKACKKEDLPPFPSTITYDAKAWAVMLEQTIKYRNKKKIVFWNVGS